jgi:hypothetical protein
MILCSRNSLTSFRLSSLPTSCFQVKKLMFSADYSRMPR